VKRDWSMARALWQASTHSSKEMQRRSPGLQPYLPSPDTSLGWPSGVDENVARKLEMQFK